MIDSQLVKKFDCIGYFVLDDVFGSEDVARLSDEFDRILAMARRMDQTQEYKEAVFVLSEHHTEDHPSIKRINWCTELSPLFAEVTQAPRLLETIACLLGSNEFEQIICQAHYKLPDDKVTYPWHQDTQKDKGEWNDVNGRGSFALAMIAIDSCTPDNGAVKVIPNSAKHGPLGIETGYPLDNTDEIVKPLIAQYGIEYLEMQPGGVGFVNPYAIHSSDNNETANSRRTLIAGYASIGAKVWKNADRRRSRVLRI